MEKSNDNLLKGAQNELKEDMNKLKRKLITETVSYISNWKGGSMEALNCFMY